MLLAAADSVPDDDRWALEVKWDGMRARRARSSASA
jgi:ATP-dependent DNA ligase